MTISKNETDNCVKHGVMTIYLLSVSGSMKPRQQRMMGMVR